MPQPIPRNVESAEILVRGIVHPLWCSVSKAKLKPEAFMPARSKAEVSVLRLIYTDEHFCKRHSRSLEIPNQEYAGMAALVAQSLQEATLEVNTPGFSVSVIATPLDEQSRLIPFETSVDACDLGLPMHADILYSEPVTQGVPNLSIQKAAKYLLRWAFFALDPDVAASGWLGAPLVPPTVAT